MAYRHSRRDELAAAKLDALGVDWDRSRGAYRQYRSLDVGRREQAIAQLQVRDPSYRPGGRTQGPARAAPAARGGYPAPSTSMRVGDATVAVTGNARTVLGLVRDAADRGDRVVIKATFRDDKGRWSTRIIDQGGSGGLGVMRAVDAAGSRGLAGSHIDQRPGRISGAPQAGVQLTIGPGVSGPRGLGYSARDWLAAFDAFDDVWDAIYAFWSLGYE